MKTLIRFRKWALAASTYILLLGALSLPAAARAQIDGAVVRALFFYSPSCGHCHYVMTETLPPLLAAYGEQLQIVALDITQPSGGILYEAAVDHFGITDERLGVPAMIIGDNVLVGSGEIPDYFPGLVESSLAGGGINWPDFPGVAVLATAAPDLTVGRTGLLEPGSAVLARAASNAIGESARDVEMASQDPLLLEATLTQSEALMAGAIALLLVLAIGYGLWRLNRYQPPRKRARPGLRRMRHGRFSFHGADFRPLFSWIVPLLATAGLAIAIYLAYVELTHASAICGPLGDCQAVQASTYARLWGVLPIALLGLLTYVAIMALWASQRFFGERLGHSGTNAVIWGILLLALAGTVFSLYLTYLELFVIHAICLWCLSSALIMASLLISVVLAETPRRPRPPRSHGGQAGSMAA